MNGFTCEPRNETEKNKRAVEMSARNLMYVCLHGVYNNFIPTTVHDS